MTYCEKVKTLGPPMHVNCGTQNTFRLNWLRYTDYDVIFVNV